MIVSAAGRGAGTGTTIRVSGCGTTTTTGLDGGSAMVAAQQAWSTH